MTLGPPTLRRRFLPMPSVDPGKAFYQLQRQLKGKEGKQVLVVEQNYESFGCGYSSREEDLVLRTTLQLGSLSGEPFKDAKRGFGGAVVIPADGHAYDFDHGSHRSEWKLREGPMHFNEFELIHFGNDVDNRHDPLRERRGGSGLLVHVGPEVEKYFTIDQRHFRKEPYLDVSYVQALGFLGLGDKASPEFRVAYDKKLGEDRLKVVTEIRNLLDEETRLTGRINQVYSMVGGVMTDGGALTLVENRESAAIITIGESQRMENVQNSIRGSLDRAIRLGMDKWEQELKIGPGTTIHVPTFISDLSKAYEPKTKGGRNKP